MTPGNAVVTVSKLDFQLVLMPPSGQKKTPKNNAALNSAPVVSNNDSPSWSSHCYKVTRQLLKLFCAAVPHALACRHRCRK